MASNRAIKIIHIQIFTITVQGRLTSSKDMIFEFWNEIRMNIGEYDCKLFLTTNQKWARQDISQNSSYLYFWEKQSL